MKQDIINVLSKLEDNDYEAFVIGGFVRDKLLGKESYDVDIVTNALPKDILQLFGISSNRASNYGTIKFSNGNYRFDIATYRKELVYNGRNPEVEYINSLEEDIKRRDFTINTIAMNKDGEIVDYLKAINDLQNRIIKCVGDVNIKLKEDPLRILRALRFSIVLDFKLDDNLLNTIKKNMNLISILSKNRIKEEFDKILVSDKALNGLDFMNKLGILKLINISYKEMIDVDDILGMYAQMNVDDDYPFNKEERKSIDSIKNIVNYGKIDNNILFEYGLYLSTVAGKILGLDSESIVKMYNNMPIKCSKDLAIEAEEIMNILNIEPTKTIKIIIDGLIQKILDNELINEKEELIKYIKEMNNNGL